MYFSMAEMHICLSNSLSALPDTRHDEVDTTKHHDSHDHPENHQPHLHRLVLRSAEGWHYTHKLQGGVIQIERLVDSPTI